MLRSRSRWSLNYLRPGAGAGAGAEIIFLIIISYSQIGGCYDEEKPPLRHLSFSTVLLLYCVVQIEVTINGRSWSWSLSLGAEIMDKGGAGVGGENK